MAGAEEGQLAWGGTTRPEVLKRCSRNGHELVFASDRFRDDRDIVMAAVLKYGYAIRVASERLQGDKGGDKERIKIVLLQLCSFKLVQSSVDTLCSCRSAFMDKLLALVFFASFSRSLY